MKKYMFTFALACSLTGLLSGCGPGNTKDIGQDKARQIALDDAGADESRLSHLRISKDRDDGKTYYEVEFLADNTEYEYEIAASDGEILSFDYEIKNPSASQEQTSGVSPSPTPAASPSVSATASPAREPADNAAPSGSISMEQAKQAVLERVPGASEANLEIELEHDDGQLIYEGEIHYNRTEYEFEIDANTGNFLKWSEDH